MSANAPVAAFAEIGSLAAQAEHATVELVRLPDLVTSDGVHRERFAVALSAPGVVRFRCCWGGRARCEAFAARLRSRPAELATIIEQSQSWKRATS